MPCRLLTELAKQSLGEWNDGEIKNLAALSAASSYWPSLRAEPGKQLVSELLKEKTCFSARVATFLQELSEVLAPPPAAPTATVGAETSKKPFARDFPVDRHIRKVFTGDADAPRYGGLAGGLAANMTAKAIAFADCWLQIREELAAHDIELDTFNSVRTQLFAFGPVAAKK